MIRFGNVISSNYIGKSAIFDAPKDGTIYGRQNGSWVEAPAGSGGGPVSNLWNSPTTNLSFDMVEWSSGSEVTVGTTLPNTEFAKWFDIVDAPVANPNDILAVWMQLVVDVDAENNGVPYDRTTVFFDRVSFGVNIDTLTGGDAFEGVRSYVGDGFIADNALNVRAKFSDVPADAGRLYASLNFGPTLGTLTFYWNARLFIAKPTSPF